MREWICLVRKRDWIWMHALRRREQSGGSDHMSELKLANASLRWPLEQRSVNSAVKVVVQRQRCWWEKRANAAKGFRRYFPIHSGRSRT